MRIAILGWGSLIWNPRDLLVSGEWQQDGPVLPIEFSRISDDGRLTLVIDEHHGVDVPTYYAPSPRPTMGEAVTDLHRHEGCPPEKIGFLEVATHRISPRARERHPKACERIKAWAVENGFDAVIWMALSPRFRDWIDAPFSPAAFVSYLRSLPDSRKEAALDCLRRAPEEVMTPVRRAAIQAGLIEVGGGPAPGGVQESDEQPYPWEDIEEARHNRPLQQQHRPEEAARYRETARPCPKCGRTSKDLAWFYFESPEWTWANLCGRSGWITVCDACHAQVDCFLEVMG